MHPYAKVMDGMVVERQTFPRVPDPATIKQVQGQPVWRPVVTENEDYDPVTQDRTGPVEVVEPERIIDRYTVAKRPRAHIEGDKAMEISLEAERRIEAGVHIPDTGLFRASVGDIARLTGLLERARLLEESGEAVAMTFKTAAGVTVTLTSAAQVKALYLAVSGFVSGVLERSATLQDGLTDLTPARLAAFDATDDQHWTQDQTIPPVSE